MMFTAVKGLLVLKICMMKMIELVTHGSDNIYKCKKCIKHFMTPSEVESKGDVAVTSVNKSDFYLHPGRMRPQRQQLLSPSFHNQRHQRAWYYLHLHHDQKR